MTPFAEDRKRREEPVVSCGPRRRRAGWWRRRRFSCTVRLARTAALPAPAQCPAHGTLERLSENRCPEGDASGGRLTVPAIAASSEDFPAPFGRRSPPSGAATGITPNQRGDRPVPDIEPSTGSGSVAAIPAVSATPRLTPPLPRDRPPETRHCRSVVSMPSAMVLPVASVQRNAGPSFMCSITSMRSRNRADAPDPISPSASASAMFSPPPARRAAGISAQHNARVRPCARRQFSALPAKPALAPRPT